MNVIRMWFLAFFTICLNFNEYLMQASMLQYSQHRRLFCYKSREV